VLMVNGGPALALSIDGELDTVATFVIEDGVVTELYLLRNPEKLSRLGQVVDLTRQRPRMGRVKTGEPGARPG
jgi:hypothetical protein